MAEEYGKPETEEQRRNREASEYWAKIAAKGGSGSDGPAQNLRQARQTEMTDNTPSAPGINPNETDPLVIIYAAIQANTNGMKEAAAQAKASRSEVAASERHTVQLFEALKTYVLANTQAVEIFTAREQMIANAETAKYWWGVGGFLAGMTVLDAGQFLWFHFFG
jgi:hypothetical protein